MSHSPESWSPDGAHLLYGVTSGQTTALWSFALADKKATPFGGVQSSEPTNAVFSPDGHWVAYTSTEGTIRRIFVQPFPASGAKHEVSRPLDVIDGPTLREGGGAFVAYPMWSPGGTELLWAGAGGLNVVSVTTRPGFTFGHPVVVPLPLQTPGPSLPRSLDITPAGTFVGMVAPGSTPAPTPTRPRFEVVLNWFEELRAKAPAKSPRV